MLVKRLFIVTSLSLALLSGSAFAQGKPDPVIAKVNGQDIHLNEVMKSLPAGITPQQRTQIFPQIQNKAIQFYAIVQGAKAAGTKDSQAYKDAIAQAQKEILANTYLEQQASANVTEAVLKATYDKIAAKGPEEEYNVSHILISDKDGGKKKAIELIGKLKAAGKNFSTEFATLAKKYSIDKRSAENGGKLGWIKAGSFVGPFKETLEKIKKENTYWPTPVKTQFGWHIIYVSKLREIPVPSFASVKAGLKKQLVQQDVQKTVNKIMDAAKIERFDINGKPIPKVVPSKVPPVVTPPAKK